MWYDRNLPKGAPDPKWPRPILQMTSFYMRTVHSPRIVLHPHQARDTTHLHPLTLSTGTVIRVQWLRKPSTPQCFRWTNTKSCLPLKRDQKRHPAATCRNSPRSLDSMPVISSGVIRRWTGHRVGLSEQCLGVRRVRQWFCLLSEHHVVRGWSASSSPQTHYRMSLLQRRTNPENGMNTFWSRPWRFLGGASLIWTWLSLSVASLINQSYVSALKTLHNIWSLIIKMGRILVLRTVMIRHLTWDICITWCHIAYTDQVQF